MTQDTRVWKDALSYILGGLIVVLVLVNALTHLIGTDSGLVGKNAPSFRLETVQGEDKLGPSDFEGEVVVMDFWATWCEPCREQTPILQELVSRDAPNFKILSINTDAATDNRRKKVEGFLDKYDADFTTLLDRGQAMRQYGINSLPGLVIVDPQGKVSYIGSGVHPTEDLTRLIEKARQSG
jgi:thiol-disulfide isomerase/thioredoxin